MNLGELKAELGRLLGDPSHSRWSEAVKTTRLNDAMTAVLADTKAVKTMNTYTPVAGTASVTINANTIDIKRARILESSGDYKSLEGMSREDLDYHYPNWMNLGNGEPLTYWFDASNQQINLVPPPDSDWAQTNGLDIWEVVKPTAMSSDSDEPFDSVSLMIPYHMALVHWAAAQCFLDDGDIKFKVHRSGNLEVPGEYERWIKKINRNFDKPTDVPQTIKWRPEGGRVGSFAPTKEYPLA